MSKGKETKYPNNRIKELRIKKGYTQTQLAELIHLNPSLISNYERGWRNPKFEIWEAMSNVFDVPIGYLRGETDDPKKESELDKLSKSLDIDLHTLLGRQADSLMIKGLTSNQKASLNTFMINVHGLIVLSIYLGFDALISPLETLVDQLNGLLSETGSKNLDINETIKIINEATSIIEKKAKNK